jgi:hypothetical protein
MVEFLSEANYMNSSAEICRFCYRAFRTLPGLRVHLANNTICRESFEAEQRGRDVADRLSYQDGLNQGSGGVSSDVEPTADMLDAPFDLDVTAEAEPSPPASATNAANTMFWQLGLDRIAAQSRLSPSQAEVDGATASAGIGGSTAFHRFTQEGVARCYDLSADVADDDPDIPRVSDFEQRRQNEDPNHLYDPFPSRAEWGLARWLSIWNLSKGAIDELRCRQKRSSYIPNSRHSTLRKNYEI